MENNRTNDTHEITLINKEKGTITGVNKVLSVKDDCIALESSMGELAISGKNFVISGYNDQNKTFSFTGTVSGLNYRGKKEPVFKKIFK